MAFIMGMPGIKNSEQAISGVHIVCVGKKCMKYAPNVTAKATAAVVMKLFMPHFKSLICKNFPMDAQMAV